MSADVVRVAAGVVVRDGRIARNDDRTDDPGWRIQRVVVETDRIRATAGLRLVSTTGDVARGCRELSASWCEHVGTIALCRILLGE